MVTSLSDMIEIITVLVPVRVGVNCRHNWLHLVAAHCIAFPCLMQ